MAEDFSKNSNLFNSLNTLVSNPFFIMDQVGNLCTYNKKAAVLFNIKELQNFYDLLDTASTESFHNLFENTLNGKSIIRLPFEFTSNKTEKKGLISVVTYIENNSTYVFCEFHEDILRDAESLENFNIDIIESDPFIQSIAYEISSYFPLTVTGKDKLRKKLDGFDNILWLEDMSGNILLLNKEFRAYFNLQNNSAEGKPADSYIIPVYRSLWNSLNTVAIAKGSIVKIDNIFFAVSGLKEKKDIIKAPIYDSKKDVVAVLSIQKSAEQVNYSSSTEKQKSFGIEYLLPLVKSSVNPSAIIASNGEILNHSKPFADKFNDGLFISEKTKLHKIFPSDLFERIEQFRESALIDLRFTYSGNISHLGRKIKSFDVYLNKIITNDILEGIFINIEGLFKDDLENVIRNRGPMFDILIEKNPEPVFLYDTENLRFLEVNEAALKLYGYKKDEFLQMDLTDLYIPEDIQTLLDSSVTKDNFGVFHGPFKHRRKNGTSVFVEISKMHFKLNEKEAHYNIIRDVTEVLELQKKIQVYKSAFDNSPSLVFLTDGNGFVTYANKAVYDSLGYMKQDLNKTSFPAFVKDQDRALINSSIFQSHIKTSVSFRIDLKKIDSSFIPAELVASPILDYKGETDSFMIICNLEKEVLIKEIRREVVNEIPTKEFQPSKITSDLDKNFLSNIFHEILTPINVIIGFIQELSESKLSSEQKEAVEIINQNRIILLNSMNSVMDYLTLEKSTSNLKIEQINITEIIDYLQKDIDELSKSRGIEFSYGKISSSLSFKTDKVKFKYLISSLLRILTEINTGKKIFLSAYNYSGNRFVISVKDSYSSISDDLLKRIKSVFLEASGKDYGVSKVTLKASKELLELLQGSLRLLNKTDNIPDYGFVFPQELSIDRPGSDEEISTFVPEPENTKIELPDEETELKEEYSEFKDMPLPVEEIKNPGFKNTLKEEEINSIDDIRKAKKQDKLNLSELSCLYIEDQIDSQILFKVQMKELKDIKFAVSFEEALPLLENFHFDFIVMDINLQGEYNGLDALKMIHKMPRYERIPIIAVTAYVLPGDREKFLVTGFQDFISKPIFHDKMIDSLERIFLMQI